MFTENHWYFMHRSSSDHSCESCLMQGAGRESRPPEAAKDSSMYLLRCMSLMRLRYSLFNRYARSAVPGLGVHWSSAQEDGCIHGDLREACRGLLEPSGGS